MPNMLADGLLKEAITLHAVSLLPNNSDFNLQAVVQQAVTTAALQGFFTCTVAMAAYATVLVQLLIKRLVDMGYTATLSGTTLTVNW